MDLDAVLMRLAQAPVPASLDGMEDRVLARVAARPAARAGLGLAHLPISVVRQDLNDGHLLAMQEEWSFHDKEVRAVFPPGIMPSATRAFAPGTASEPDAVRPARAWCSARRAASAGRGATSVTGSPSMRKPAPSGNPRALPKRSSRKTTCCPPDFSTRTTAPT